jgi:hypothetical protein
MAGNKRHEGEIVVRDLAAKRGAIRDRVTTAVERHDTIVTGVHVTGGLGLLAGFSGASGIR